MVNLKLFLNELNKHAPLKKKFLRHNNNPFMTKDLRKQIMVRSKLRKSLTKTETMKTGVNISVNAIFA